MGEMLTVVELFDGWRLEPWEDELTDAPRDRLIHVKAAYDTGFTVVTSRVLPAQETRLLRGLSGRLDQLRESLTNLSAAQARIRALEARLASADAELADARLTNNDLYDRVVELERKA